jgi:CheY-like chemotaxis protein
MGSSVKISDGQPVVLVAEDREEDLFLIRRAFEHLGFATPVQYVRDGEQVIAYLSGEGRFSNRAEYPLPNVLLLDLKMPRKTGFDVLKWLQQQPSLSRLRTVVLTTSFDLHEITQAYKLGASSFLTKPLNFTEFKDTIQSIYNYWVTINKAPEVDRVERPPILNPYQKSSPTLDSSDPHGTLPSRPRQHGNE